MQRLGAMYRPKAHEYHTETNILLGGRIACPHCIGSTVPGHCYRVRFLAHHGRTSHTLERLPRLSYTTKVKVRGGYGTTTCDRSRTFPTHIGLSFIYECRWLRNSFHDWKHARASYSYLILPYV